MLKENRMRLKRAKVVKTSAALRSLLVAVVKVKVRTAATDCMATHHSKGSALELPGGSLHRRVGLHSPVQWE